MQRRPHALQIDQYPGCIDGIDDFLFPLRIVEQLNLNPSAEDSPAPLYEAA
jgi:hypothetical protein